MSIGKKVDEIIKVKDAEIMRYAHREAELKSMATNLLNEIEIDMKDVETLELRRQDMRLILTHYKNRIKEALK